MTVLAGGKRKMTASPPPAMAEESNGGGGASPLQRQRLAERLRGIQAQVATLQQKSSSPSPSPEVVKSEDVGGGGANRVGEETAAPALGRVHRLHPTSSAAAYTDYSAVPEPCTLQDVLDINAKSNLPAERRALNESAIRRRGGGGGDDNADGGGKGEGGGGGGKGRRGPNSHATFPARLHDILSRPDLSGVISWMDHGRAWRIVDQSAFINRVMPHYFSQSKIASFMRQVNGWGFARVTRGDEVNSYYSEFFLRGKKSLVRFMERKPAVRDLLGPEPNFAEYEDLPPNPEVDPASLLPLPPVESMKARGRGGGRRGGAIPDGFPPYVGIAGAHGGQWTLQQAVMLQAQFPGIQQPQPSQMFLGHQQNPQFVIPQQSVQQGQLLQQQQQQQMMTSFQPMPIQIPSSTMMPDMQASMNMTPQGFQASFQGDMQQLQQQQQMSVANAPNNIASVSPELSPALIPRDMHSPNNLMLQQGALGMPDDALDLKALVQSGQLPIEQQAAPKQIQQQLQQFPNPEDKQGYQQHLQQVPNAEDKQGYQQHLQQVPNFEDKQGYQQHLQQTTGSEDKQGYHQHQNPNFKLMDPTPFFENKKIVQVTHSELKSFGTTTTASNFAAMIAPLDDDPFAGDDDEHANLEMEELDITGMVPPPSMAPVAPTSAGGTSLVSEDDFDDIW